MFVKEFKAISLLLMLLSTAAFGKDVKLLEGTEVKLQVTEKLTSASATEGQRFDLVLDDDIRVDGEIIIPKGSKALGTVVSARKKGMMGKAGELNIQINYVLFNEQRIPLRASQGREGQNKIGTTVALTVLFGPIGLLKRGHDVEVLPGIVLPAVVDQTTIVVL